MKKIISIFIVILAVFYFGCVLSIETADSPDSVKVKIILSISPKLEREEGLAGTVHMLKLLNCYEVKELSTVPVRSGPLDFVSVFSLSGRTYISFQTIIPTNPVITVSGREIDVVFMKSPRRYDYSFSDTMQLTDVIKYFAETLGLNISISPSVLQTSLPSLRLENTTPEDAFRTILLSLGLVYTYFPNGVMYISNSLDDIKSKLLELWGVSSEEALLDAVKAGILRTLSNESMIFTMGPHESLREIVEESRREYYEIVDVEDKASAKSILDEMLGGRLKVITTLPGSAVMIFGKGEDVSEALKILGKTGILARSTKKRATERFYKVLDVVDPESAKGLIEGIYPSIKVVPTDGKIVIYGTEDEIAEAVKLLRDVGFIGITTESSTQTSLPSKPVVYEIINVKEPEEVAKYVEGIFEGIKVVVGKGRMAIVGRREQVEEVKKLVKKLERGEEETIEVWSVSDPEGVSRVISEVFEGLKVVPGKGEVIVKGYKDIIDRVKGLLEKIGAFESGEKREVEIVRVQDPETVSSVISNLFPNLVVISLSDGIILSGSKEDIETAKEIAEKISSPRKVIWKIVKARGISDEQIGVLEKMAGYFGVEVIRIPGGERLILVGRNKDNIDKVEKMVEEISRGLTVLPVIVEDGNITIKADGVKASDLVEMALRELGKGVVVLEDVSSPVKMDVSSISLEEFLKIMKDFGVDVEERDGIYFVKRLKLRSSEVSIPSATTVEVKPQVPSTPVTVPEVPVVQASGGFLDVRCSGCNLSKVLEELAEELNLNVVFVDRPDFPVTMNMKNVTMEELLEAVRSFGYTVQEKDGIYYVKKIEAEELASATSAINLDVKFKGGKAFVLAENIPLSTVVKELSKGFGLSIVMVDTPSEKISVKVDGMTVADLKMLLEKFGYTLEEIDGISYLIKKGRTIVGKVVYGFDKLQSLVQSLGGQMFYDPTTGMVIARNLSSGAYNLVKKYLDMLKESPPQVSIEVKLIEKLGNESLNLGASLGVEGNEINVGSSFSGAGEGIGNLRINTSVISSSSYENILKGLLGGRVNLTLSGAKNRGDFRLIASPSVTVMSGESAKIVIGGEDFITLGGTVVRYESGVNLNITPYVRPDGKIDLKVVIELSDITSLSAAGVSRKTRSAQTRVVLEDGQTLVIGGLMREVKEEKISKLPILGDLPVIGWLFRSKSDRKEISNLTIFITAKVVRE